ncbi:MAG: hypothetical protein ACM37W_23700 [Actinomycetota bacterium]
MIFAIVSLSKAAIFPFLNHVDATEFDTIELRLPDAKPMTKAGDHNYSLEA